MPLMLQRRAPSATPEPRLWWDSGRLRVSSLSPPGQRRGEAAAQWRRLSTRDARPSTLVSDAAWTAARRGLRPSPPVSSSPGQRPGEAAMRWTAAQLGSCALAPPSTRDARPLPLVSVAAWTAARRGSYALDSGAARQL